jgi:hypothetical protein
VPESCTTPDVQLPLSFEEWRPIAGFDGRYLVSSLGRVRSLERLVWVPVLEVFRPLRGRILKPQIVSGYPMYCLHIDGMERRRHAHRLVLETFVGPCPQGMQGCHNDGNPLNPALQNLRWDTAKGNQADRIRHGTAIRGEAMAAAKLSEEDVREIRRLSEAGMNQSELSRRFSVSRRLIGWVVDRSYWRHVT